MQRTAGVVLAALGATGCFKVAPSRGVGEVSAERAARAEAVTPDPYDVELPPGYAIDLVADHLTFPTGIAIGARDELYVVESGYSYGERFTKARLLRIVPGAAPRELATGDGAPWNGVDLHDGALFVAEGGELEGGRIVRFDLRGDGVAPPRVLVDHLPSFGDHHTNGPIVSRDGWVYFGQGTATNAGVVGEDDAMFGWLDRHPELHDVPCRDVTLSGLAWTTEDRRKGHQGKVTTGAFHAYGTTGERGEVIAGHVPCSGAVMRVKADGGPVELVAWGFRNPFGLAFDPSGALFVDDNGYDVRGSRPVFGAADVLWKVEPGEWYGWPDYAEGRPLTAEAFQEGGGDPKGFVLAAHPGEPRAPRAPTGYFPVHASADGLDFARGDAFGHAGSAFVALFGDMAPTVGKVIAPVGFEVVRVDPRTGAIEDFARNRGDATGPASKLGSRGLERPVAVRFNPRGDALYVVDFGVIRLTDQGPEPQPATGRIWRITRGGGHASR
jgi:glucose/arabinose dehydrogenase